MIDLSEVCISVHHTLGETMLCIDRNCKGIALVVDGERRLLFTITDGDLRRAVLHGLSLELTIEQWAKQRLEQGNLHPITMPLGTPLAKLRLRMQAEDLRHIPLVDETGSVVDLALLNEIVTKEDFSAVIMAGGYGTRLRPLTEELPKPLLPVGGRPLMERIIEQLRQAGIQRVNVTTHYLSEKIVNHFGDGKAFGVDINYVTEDRPLGTAGALGLMAEPNEPLLVINGDILTQLDFRTMLSFHREHQAEMTVGVRQYDLQVPYGVMECDGPYVREVREKPLLSFLVNAGIYLLAPSVYRYIPDGQRFDMTDLIQRLLDDGRPVVSFPIVEYWLDIGQHADYEQAEIDVTSGRFSS